MRDVKPTAVVMNMFYTGLGIARSLGEHGIPVIGLTAHRGAYGEFTRYAQTVRCPDSRSHPQEALKFLLQLGQKLGKKSVLFPTRDDDVILLDRHRDELDRYFSLVLPGRAALGACLNKWETYLAAKQAGVAAPQCWLIANEQELLRTLPQLTYPCVLKAVTATDWRQGDNWAIVGGRKAVPVFSERELLTEYRAIANADERALIQELVAGGDDHLMIAACYLDRAGRYIASFNTRKLLQVPEGFGTGCIVQATDCTEATETAVRLLQAMRFNGIAEVEFKWDAGERKYKLIEVNPRAWDQHRLGTGCGTDLTLLAYHEHAGLEMPVIKKRVSHSKWIAEDVFLITVLRLFVKRDPQWREMLRLAKGHRVYAIWSATDPLPAIRYAMFHVMPDLLRTGARVLRSAFRRRSLAVRSEGSCEL